jgi:rhodanese-related sulfurtransferase
MPLGRPFENHALGRARPEPIAKEAPMKTLNANQLKMVLGGPQHAKLIDVLPEESFEKEHIEGAVNIPVEHDDFVQRVEDLVDEKDNSVIVYCASKDCDASSTAARRLDDAGFSNVYDFEGGIREWKETGYKTVQHATT